MNHVTDNIQVWLSGELSATEKSQLESHLENCPACARSAKEARDIWEDLGRLAERPSVSGASVWPAVREKTLDSKETGSWFFGGGRLVQSSLATAALAAGLFLGILLPGGGSDQIGGDAEALTLSDTQMESAWLTDTSWGEGISEFESAWIGAGLDETNDDSTEGLD